MLNRWNSFSQLTLDAAWLDNINQIIGLRGYDLQTELALMENSSKGTKLVCFRGWCEFTSFAKEPQINEMLCLLALCAFYSGIGYKATQGFGQLSVTFPTKVKKFAPFDQTRK